MDIQSTIRYTVNKVLLSSREDGRAFYMLEPFT